MPRPPRDKVILKLEGDDAIAFFPDYAGTNDPCTCSCYAHVGQHASASVDYARNLRPLPADDTRARDLLREIRAIGYRPRIVRRFTRQDLAARREQVRT